MTRSFFLKAPVDKFKLARCFLAHLDWPMRDDFYIHTVILNKARQFRSIPSIWD